MADLEKQLRELSKDQFESFVHQYLMDRFPGADVKRVDGAGGDGGIDSFTGLLEATHAIWQAKHFPDRIRRPQQRQIMKSVKAAFKNKTPAFWTLCVPINLRTSEHTWFQSNIVTKYGGAESIKLIQASDFLHEIRLNRSLRDMFFPENAQSTAMDIRKVLTQTDKLSLSQVNKVAVEYAQQYLEGDLNIDPRLDAVLSIGGTPTMRQPIHQEGLVMSVTTGDQTANFFAKEPTVFNRDPIKMIMNFRHQEGLALQAAIEAGRAIRFPAGSVTEIDGTSPLFAKFFGKSDLSQLELVFSPTLPDELTTKTIPLRFTTGTANDRKVLKYLPFRIVRAGSKEVELLHDATMPVQIRLGFSLCDGGGATLNLEPICADSDVQQLNVIFEFIDAVQSSGALLVESIEHDLPLIDHQGKWPASESAADPMLRSIISKAAVVSRIFGTRLTLPKEIAAQEMSDLQTLEKIATGEAFTDVRANTSALKSSENDALMDEYLREESFTLTLPHTIGTLNFVLFGKVIDPGEVTFVGKDAVVDDLNAFQADYGVATYGTNVPVTIHCRGECRFVRQVVATA